MFPHYCEAVDVHIDKGLFVAILDLEVVPRRSPHHLLVSGLKGRCLRNGVGGYGLLLGQLILWLRLKAECRVTNTKALLSTISLY